MRNAHRWAIALGIAAVAVVAVPIGIVAEFAITQSVGRTTVVTESDGQERTVYWREYPGVSGLSIEETLNGPTAEDAYAAGESMVADMRDALTAEFGLEWAPDPFDDGTFDPFHENTQNWFGGESLLTLINAPTSQSTSIPTSWSDKQQVIEIMGEVAATYGFGVPVLDHERDASLTDEDRIEQFGGATPDTQILTSGVIEGPTGQWLFFTLMDLSLDADGQFAERVAPSVGSGWQRNTITLSYGANALLPEGNRAEFERRAQPFIGVPPPEPLET